MREKFWGYFPLNESDFKEIAEDSYIILDTNILLNFYRYSKDTKDKLIKILEDKKERLFLNEIVLKEFFRNRYSLINEHCNVKDKIETHLGKMKNVFKSELDKYRHMYLDKEKLEKFMDNFEENIRKELDKCDIIDFQEEDPILKQIMDLFNNDIIKDFEECRKHEETKNAKERYDSYVPPGYKDYKKDSEGKDAYITDDHRKYNDYFIWMQIIEFSKEHNKNIIFITDDNKEDWFRKNNGKTIGPREELLNEFYKKTEGNKVYIYSTQGFLKSINTPERDLTNDMMDEIKEISEYDDSIRRRPKINIDNTILNENHIQDIVYKLNLSEYNNRDENKMSLNEILTDDMKMEILYNKTIAIHKKIDNTKKNLEELNILMNENELSKREKMNILSQIRHLQNRLNLLYYEKDNLSIE